jgi:hypothetical protein
MTRNIFDTLSTVDRIGQGEPTAVDVRKENRTERNRVIAKEVKRDLRDSLRHVRGWNEWQVNVIRKAIRDLEAIK